MAFDWKNLIKTVAPTLGAAIGGPVGGMATKFIADKWLGDPDATEEDIIAALQGATPEQMVQLKALDNQFEIEMKRLDIDVFALEIQDRQGARGLFKINIWPQIIISILFLGGYFVILGLMVTGAITIVEGIKDMLLLLVGLLTREVPTIMQFWFGSSFGSKEKTATLQATKVD